jgi:TetR/AcrR family transcriptional repressor of nem operon
MTQDREMRTRLLDAAQALVQRVGANAMSFQDLSDAVGIRKASVHHHFPTKSDLLRALIDRYAEYFLGVVRTIATSRGSGLEQFRKYCGLFEATLASDRGDKACPCGMLGAEIATLDEKPAVRLREFYRANARLLGEILERGRADGSLDFDGAGESLAWLVFSHLEGAMLVARVEGGAKSLRAQCKQFEKLIAA